MTDRQQWREGIWPNFATCDLDDHRGKCRCKPWEQRWRPETPKRCVNCGGMFAPHTVCARRPRLDDGCT